MKQIKDGCLSCAESVCDECVFPVRLTLRDTCVYADEGQRIFTTATGYGYSKCEYIRADVVREWLND